MYVVNNTVCYRPQNRLATFAIDKISILSKRLKTCEWQLIKYGDSRVVNISVFKINWKESCQNMSRVFFISTSNSDFRYFRCVVNNTLCYISQNRLAAPTAGKQHFIPSRRLKTYESQLTDLATAGWGNI